MKKSEFFLKTACKINFIPFGSHNHIVRIKKIKFYFNTTSTPVNFLDHTLISPQGILHLGSCS